MKYHYYTFFIYLLLIVLFIFLDPFNFVTNYTDIFIFIFTLLALILTSLRVYISSGHKDTSGFLIKLLFFILFIFIFIFIIFFITYFLIFSNISMNLFALILNIFIVIGALAFIYQFFNKFLKQQVSGYLLLELLLNIIFYIPCLFTDFIEFIKYQLKITTKPVWIILGLEILFIAIRILVPYLYILHKKYISPLNSVIIEEGPLYLNNEKVVGVFQDLNNTDRKNYNYAISCKLWINPQPNSTSDAYNKRTSLLNYGDIINIYHYKNKLEVFVATTNENNNAIDSNNLIKIYEDDNILYQRWNSIVINYLGGTLDIFINNKLVLSEINITPLFFANKIICGSKNGINGGIKSLTYYDKALSKNEVEYIYNI